MSEKEDEEFDVCGLALQFFRDGKWSIPLDLAQALNDVFKEEMRHTSFRFVLYGQLGPPNAVPQPGEPEHERFPRPTAIKRP